MSNRLRASAIAAGPIDGMTRGYGYLYTRSLDCGMVSGRE